MIDKQFDWARTKQLSLIQILLAFAIPSAIAYCGFHIILPELVQRGLPILIAWSIIASIMLAGLVLVAIIFMQREAKALNLTLVARMCLKKLTTRQWMMYLAVMIVGLALASATSQLIQPFMNLLNLQVPEHMPFFLDPSINPVQDDPEVVSPGYPLAGKIILLPLFFLALLLNILAEELYFRAWMLPKMATYGNVGWILNGSLFALYHVFQFWLFPTIFVGSLVWAFVVFHSKSIVPAFIGHFIGNFLLTFIALSLLILG